MEKRKMLSDLTAQNDRSIGSFLKQMTLSDGLFVLAIATKPLYLRSSGSVQISDLLFALVFGMFCFSGAPLVRKDRERRWLAVLTICVLYQFVVNMFWYFRTQNQTVNDYSMLKSNLYYIFNLIVCVTVLQLNASKGFQYTLRLVLMGFALSVAVALVGVLFQYRGFGRARGFFNNPNQLGYYCIVALTVVTFFAKDIRPSVRFLLVVATVGMSLLSLSKASILASTVLLCAYFVRSRDRAGDVARLLSILISVIAVAVLIYILIYADWEFLNEKHFIVMLRKRIGALTTENDSSFATGRGYARLKEISFWIFTGVGEGAYSRFTTMTGKEVHSTYASFIVSYGFIGFFLLVKVICDALFSQKQYLRNLLCFSGILAYGLTHNGIRSTLLWVLITMLLVRPATDELPGNRAGGIQRP